MRRLAGARFAAVLRGAAFRLAGARLAAALRFAGARLAAVLRGAALRLAGARLAVVFFAAALRLAGARLAVVFFAVVFRAVVLRAGDFRAVAFRVVGLFAGGTVTSLSVFGVDVQVTREGDLFHGGLELGTRRELDSLGRGDLNDLPRPRVATLPSRTLRLRPRPETGKRDLVAIGYGTLH